MLPEAKMTNKKKPKMTAKFERISIRERLRRFTPYLLHFSMCLGVAAYVLIGAYTIRGDRGHPADRILENTGRSRWADDQQEAGAIQRVKRKAPLQRSRKCVQHVLLEMSKGCPLTADKQEFDARLLQELDECYKEDINERVRRFSTDLPAVKTAAKQTNQTAAHSEEEEGEWEKWSYKDAVLFCFTVITTIGYGNVAPVKRSGQIFVIFYGLVGVPCCLLVVANLGKFLAEVLKAANGRLTHYFRLCFCRRRRHPAKKALLSPLDENGNEVESESEGSTPFGLFVVFLLYIAAGSLLMSTYEDDMSFFKAIYFNFITLTMRQLVKNLGDQFNLPERGELATLRDPTKIRPIYITDFKHPFREGRVLWVDEDERSRSSGFEESSSLRSREERESSALRS
ncbi:TWiK family of potassium channels protein 9 [Aphelenchoides fujianensis]|nr:TWiK family of potassium channels protein 9 [Aphelenchoides fujianensis]